MADYLSRDQKLPAPSISQFDEQIAIKSVKNFDIACRNIQADKVKNLFEGSEIENVKAI